MTNTSVLISHFDAAKFPSTISVASRPKPVAKAGEALVRLTLRAVNPVDALSAQGHFVLFAPKAFPAVPGWEGVGTIESFGEGVNSPLKPGQRVVALEWGANTHANGTFQQYVTVPADDLVPVPDDVPDQFAAAAVVNPITVLGLLELANVPSGGTLLVTAAGSALNQLLVKLASSKGIKVIGTVRRAEARDALLAAGFAEIIVTKEGEGLVEAVQKATGGKGVNAALDSVAGPGFAKLVQSVAFGGKVIVYGAQSGDYNLHFSIGDGLFRGVSVHGFTWNLFMNPKSPAEARQVLVDVLKLNQQGIFTLEPGEEVPLEQAAEALGKQFNVGQGKKIFLKG